MSLVKHKFIDHQVSPNTETLIIGTFNPDTEENPADFFYGRSRNFLWQLLPTAYRENSLKEQSRQHKLNFINNHAIDFIDLITEVDVEEVANYEDRYLDSRVTEWRNVIGVMEGMQNLQRVCLTRKTLTDIPNMGVRVNAIQAYCRQNDIHFQCLITPARFYSQDKQTEWTNFFQL